MPEETPELDSLAELREEYTLGGLSEDDLDPDPVAMLRRWTDDAIAARLHEPAAMVLSTVSATGQPSSRILLCKGLSEHGLVFYTNYSSRKGEELAGQDGSSLVFPWHPLQRQVRVEGRVTRVSDEESDQYFSTRPRASQLSAWASPQSKVVESRAALDRRYADVESRFLGQDVPRPPFWGGYRMVPHMFEFWQGRRGRLHDRLRYRRVVTRADAPWLVERLAP